MEKNLKLFFSGEEVTEAFPRNSWQHIMFKETEATLTSRARPFPCVFGVAGFNSGQLRFTFSENMQTHEVAAALEEYLLECRRFGRNTSLLVYSRPGPVQSIATYEEQFWSLLEDLAATDKHSWPPHIPEQLDHPMWEFCFNGEPIFVVCNTPAHVNRQSRRASCFMLTFQPRWVFDDILGTPEIAAKSTGKVRRRLEPYDLVPPSPALGTYGDTDNREYSQYYLGDTNAQSRCPIHSLTGHSTSTKEKAA
jgi:uncharacterized protein